jgi:predicted HTH domain antitoxin
MAKAQIVGEGAAKKSLEKAAKDWRAAKKRERDARDEVARIVVEVVKAGLVTENKAAKITDIPRMTIRKMLGKN